MYSKPTKTRRSKTMYQVVSDMRVDSSEENTVDEEDLGCCTGRHEKSSFHI